MSVYCCLKAKSFAPLCLSLPKCKKEVPPTYSWGYPSDKLGSHPGEEAMVLECNLCQDTFSIKPLRNRPSFLYSVPVLYLYLVGNCMMTKTKVTDSMQAKEGAKLCQKRANNFAYHFLSIPETQTKLPGRG